MLRCTVKLAKQAVYPKLVQPHSGMASGTTKHTFLSKVLKTGCLSFYFCSTWNYFLNTEIAVRTS